MQERFKMSQMFLGLPMAEYWEFVFYIVGKKHIWNLSTVLNLDSLTSCNSLLLSLARPLPIRVIPCCWFMSVSLNLIEWRDLIRFVFTTLLQVFQAIRLQQLENRGKIYHAWMPQIRENTECKLIQTFQRKILLWLLLHF